MNKILSIFAVLMMTATFAKAASLSDIEAAVMDKDYEQARTLSKQLIKDKPASRDFVLAQYYYGLSQLRLKQYTESRKAFQVVMHDSSDAELYDKAALGLIESLYMPGFYTDALKEGEALLRKHPNSQSKSLIYLKIARANLKLMRWQKAKEYLQKITSEFPQSFEAPIAEGLLEEKEYFTVQVGSFLDKEKALRLVEELKNRDQYAYTVAIDAPGGKTFYRVRVGQMTSLGDAQALENELTKLGYPTLIFP
jgi:outer membrane protein assembly factor BamD (BamD/ComL family)